MTDLTTTIAAPTPCSGSAAPTMTRSGGDSDTDTPPRPNHQHPGPPTAFLAFANGPLNRHYPTAPKTELTATATPVSYKECLRNHAASMGGHALDGCCEFMPSPAAVPSVPTSLKCAACGCHRNFHRRDPDDPSPIQHHPAAPPGHHLHNSKVVLPPAPHTLLALRCGGVQTHHSSSGGEGQHHLQQPPSGGGKIKRFRTKFSKEQKEKMLELSEKMGWKIQKSDERMAEEFCKEVGVGRGALKVWMHNNKHTFGKNKMVNMEVEIGNSDTVGNHCTTDANASTSGMIMNNGSSGASHNGLYVNGHSMMIIEDLGNFVGHNDNHVHHLHLQLHRHGGGGGGGDGSSARRRPSSSSSSG